MCVKSRLLRIDALALYACASAATAPTLTLTGPASAVVNTPVTLTVTGTQASDQAVALLLATTQDYLGRKLDAAKTLWFDAAGDRLET